MQQLDNPSKMGITGSRSRHDKAAFWGEVYERERGKKSMMKYRLAPCLSRWYIVHGKSYPIAGPWTVPCYECIAYNEKLIGIHTRAMFSQLDEMLLGFFSVNHFPGLGCIQHVVLHCRQSS
jgi:hypothetical protein